MSDVTLLDALDALASLPHAAPPRAIAKIARDLIGAQRTAFFAADADGIARTGVDEDGNTILRPPRTAADLEPFYLADEPDGLTPLYDLEPGPWLTIRLDAAGPRGAIIADGLPGRPNPEELRTWRAFGSTLALRLAMTNELVAVTQRAETDALTGAAMRAVAYAAVEERLHEGTPVTLIFIDLDNFKTINDTQGHEEGDRVLMRTAATLRAACRPGDVVARQGGDEFVVVSSTSPELLAPRLTVALSTAMVDASIGYATSSAGHLTREALFEAADVHMYSIKRSRKAQRQHSDTRRPT